VIASQSFDLDEILNLTLRQVISLLGARVLGSIYVSESRNATFRRRADWGHSSSENGPPSRSRAPRRFGELVTAPVLKSSRRNTCQHLPPPGGGFVARRRQQILDMGADLGTDRPLA